jgi:hypothetical protein
MPGSIANDWSKTGDRDVFGYCIFILCRVKYIGRVGCADTMAPTASTKALSKCKILRFISASLRGWPLEMLRIPAEGISPALDFLLGVSCWPESRPLLQRLPLSQDQTAKWEGPVM